MTKSSLPSHVPSICRLLIVIGVGPMSPTLAQSDFFREDFDDADILVTATGHIGSRIIEDGSYIVVPDADARSFASVALDAPLSDFSMSTRVRTVGVPTTTGYFILIGRDTDDDLFNLFFGAVSTSGDLLVGEVRQPQENVQAQIAVNRTVGLGFNPVDNDVFLQVDFVGPVVSVFAWPESAEKPLRPQARMQNSRLLSGDLFSLEYNPPSDLTPAAYRFFELSAVLGDFDENAKVDAHDFDELGSQLRNSTVNPRYDLNVDGSVDQLDLGFWVEEVAVTKLGDANLDRKVGFPDFLSLSQNYGQPGGWASGDFDGTGSVQFKDFLILSSNFRRARAFATVPEPDAAPLLLLGLVGVVRRRDALSVC